MKVVINNCFGGFSLSPKAVKRLAELQGKPCYFFNDGIGDKPYKEVSIEECKSLFWSAFTIQNPNEATKKGKDWHSMTNKEKDEWNKYYDYISLTSIPDDRTDKLLIQVIEELGEEANGSCASLKIIEIPDGIEYEISEYDGNEHIAEIHRTWG